MVIILSNEQEMPYYGLSRGKVLTVPLKGQFERIQISPEV